MNAVLAASNELRAEVARPDEGEHQRGQQRDAHRDGERREKRPSDAGDRDERQEDHDRRQGGADERHRQLLQCACRRLQRSLPAVAVQHDVFDDDDLVVDDEPHGGRQPAERHQVEALAEELHRDERHHHRHRHDEARHERGAPVAEEQPDDERGEEEADDDRVADALDRLLETELQLQLTSGETDRVEVGLPGPVEVTDVTGDAILQWYTRW